MKNRSSFIIISCAMLMLAACAKNNKGNNGNGSDTTNPTTGAPVEKNAANTNYRPAFAGTNKD